MRCQSPCADNLEVAMLGHTPIADADSDPGTAECLQGMVSRVAGLSIAQPA
jgi:hypothetical protein